MKKSTKKIPEKKFVQKNKPGQKIVDSIKRRISREVLESKENKYRQGWDDDWDAYSDWDNSN